MSRDSQREVVRRARQRLDDWTFEARDRAYADLFEGDDAFLSAEELRHLDEIDSELARREGRGLWGDDEYGIVATGGPDEEGSPQVVCTYHPQIPEYTYRGAESLDEDTRRKYDQALWEYSERIVEYLQERLDAFVREYGDGSDR